MMRVRKGKFKTPRREKGVLSTELGGGGKGVFTKGEGKKGV